MPLASVSFPEKIFPRLRHLKLVIVDDSRIVRERLTDLLMEVDGVEIVGMAEDAPQAREIIGTQKPDAATIDLRMQDDNGLDLLAEVKANYPSMIAIVLTNYASDENRKKSLDRGADYFFDKSHDVGKLVSVLKVLSVRH
jgi:DNA-binding NarL/FixJ family response regulator